MKKIKNTLLIAIALSLSACSTPIKESVSSLESSSFEVPATSYQGESTMYVYESTISGVNHKAQKAILDITFVVKNGEPIFGSIEKMEEVERSLNPDLTQVTGDAYHISSFYYDIDCTRWIGLEDIATESLNLFYYVRG